jgi:RING finger and CHY zinc finger domain-containing protein 1
MSKKLKCKHYDRSCLIHSLCCNKWYSCRLCHDENENHIIDRFKISKIQCIKCLTEQKPSNKCINCNNKFSEYYCDICHLWESNKDIFHCKNCGFCRNGKKEKMYHCKKCNICIPNELKLNHTCIENSPHNNCPICLDYMFTSTKELIMLNCGHWIHKECINEYGKNDYRCPICKKSMWDMDTCWKKMAECMNEIEIPNELENLKSRIICNDCNFKSIVNYSVIHQCSQCNSWNTYLEEVINNN